MISTATAATSAWGKRGSGPTSSHTAKVTAAMARMAGTKTALTRSTSFCTGARVREASDTIWTIFDSSVSAPTCSAQTTSPPSPFSVPPVTRSPGAFSTGIGSPVTIDSSTDEWPSSITASVGTRSPALTRSRSPTTTSVRGTSVSTPSSAMRRAVFGASRRSDRMASPVRLRARSSSTCPSSTSVVMTAAASK